MTRRYDIAGSTVVYVIIIEVGEINDRLTLNARTSDGGKNKYNNN